VSLNPRCSNLTHVWFQVYGANLTLDADDNIESAGALTLAAYLMLCEAAGLPRPNVLIG
jgi:2,4'-dihydroxyacetophenone dioxygenase